MGKNGNATTFFESVENGQQFFRFLEQLWWKCSIQNLFSWLRESKCQKRRSPFSFSISIYTISINEYLNLKENPALEPSIWLAQMKLKKNHNAIQFFSSKNKTNLMSAIIILKLKEISRHETNLIGCCCCYSSVQFVNLFTFIFRMRKKL